MSGIELTSLASLRDALQTLQTYNVPNVVISSIPIKPWPSPSFPPPVPILIHIHTYIRLSPLPIPQP
jgi:hypothetical protein